MKQASERPTPEQFLSRFPLEIQVLAADLRALLKDAIPDAEERVIPAWGMVGYRVAHMKKTIHACFIVPKPDHVQLGFEQGVYLDDLYGLLTGKGTQVRYIPIHHAADINRDVLLPYIQDSVRFATMPRDARDLLKRK